VGSFFDNKMAVFVLDLPISGYVCSDIIYDEDVRS
jgi:hypothetical protein